MRAGYNKSALRCGVAIIAVCAATAAWAQTKSFDIPAEDANKAIPEFARQAGIQIVAPGDELKGVRTPAVKGNLETRVALSQLLSGTGTKIASDDGQTVVLTGASKNVQAGASKNVQAAPSEGAAGVQPNLIESVIVTADKREQRLQDVPNSVSAITGNVLRANNDVRLQDYASMAPGLAIADGSFTGGATQIVIRGIATGGDASPSVGIYVDDVPYGSNSFLGSITVPDLDPLDLARVEVLRGPQGTLYGAGAMGGLLKYVTVQPDPEKLYGRAEIGGSQVDGGGAGFSLRGAVNVPLSDNLALRVSGFDRQDPGYTNDPQANKSNINSGQYEGGRAALAWYANDDWKFTLSGLVQQQAANGCGCVDFNAATHQPLTGGLDQNRAPGTGNNSQFIGVYDLAVNGNLGWATLDSTSSFTKQQLKFNNDFSGLFSPIYAPSYGLPAASLGTGLLEKTNLSKFTQEVRLSSSIGDSFTWRVGGYYDKEDLALNYTGTTFSPTTGAPLGLASFLTQQRAIPFEELAVFGDATYTITPQFDISGGLRYSDNWQGQSNAVNGGAPKLQHSAGNALTFSASPRYHIDDDTMIYLRIASGYRAGGPNGCLVAACPTSFGSDNLVNYEAGMKSSFFQNTVTLDLAAYYIDWNNIQVSTTISGATIHENAGNAVSKGFEATATWTPVDHLTFSGNASYDDAALTTALLTGAAVGARLPFTPLWSAQLGADYDIPLWSDWVGVLGVNYRFVGQRTNGVPSTWTLPSYNVADLRAGISNDLWAVNIYAKNVGNNFGESNATTFLGPIPRVSIIQPRTFGLSLSRSF